jgi:ADP-heptose:LPS heptosyltransferase
MYDVSKPELAKRYYDAAFFTWFVRNHRKSMPARIVLGSKSPQKLRLTESEASMRALMKAGWTGETPRPICGKRKPKVKLPGGMLIGVTTGSRLTKKWKAKRYPGEHYSAAFDIILKRYPDANFAHVGVRTDSDIAHPRVIDFREKLPLPQVAGVISQCHAFVGNDTGLSHVAAALEVPTTVLFGPTLIKKNLPPYNATALSLELPCQPCQHKTWFKVPGQATRCNLECMFDLSPTLVAKRVLEDLENVTV